MADDQIVGAMPMPAMSKEQIAEAMRKEPLMFLSTLIPITREEKDLDKALRNLKTWDSLMEDLSYPKGDPRRMIPEASQPPEILVERDRLRSKIVELAALACRESLDDARIFADTPMSPSNPYNLAAIWAACKHARWAVAAHTIVYPPHPVSALTR